jgi:tripartite-type tricarboxylate transporter receptor subunit TctC
MRTLIAALLLALALPGQAQYPTRPVRIVVSIPPGGAPDIAARFLAERLTPAIGQPVIVENKPGANGNVGAELVARSAPDGYTLLLGADSLFAINPHLYSRMPVDVLKDLVPVASVASNMFVLSINPALPVRTLPEFVEYAKKANPPLSYASGGNGSQHHLMMEQFRQRAGIELLHVPYKGGAPATAAAVAGDVAAVLAGTSSAPQLKAGRLRGLAVTSAKRSEAFPEVPAIAEFYPGFEMTIWLGLFAPAGTPEPVLARLREEVAKALASPDIGEKFANAGGLQPFLLPQPEFAELIRRDHARFGKLVKDVGAKVD